MTNATLDPKTIESLDLTGPSVPSAEATPRAEVADASAGHVKFHRLPKRQATQSSMIPARRPGLLGRSFHMLRDASFQVGLSLPGKLWYKESKDLNAKQRAVMDAEMQGFL
ncbi:MAG: hypothetical protein BZY75_02500 [SAR202 cluster bacterium Io17-Chloro-G7]|nr:MAG: hypothetical protein BZY75_02500 [SAR202 cluster bacterium Io17-Chloro-G7]